jgi:uroporphyrinogen decarboxylase
MLNASSEEVYAATKDLLALMAPYPNFMVSFGCDCPVDTPAENLSAVLQAVYA